MHDPFLGEAADLSRHPGIGQGAALVIDPAQVVAPHGLHHCVAVHPRRKPRPQGDHRRRILDAGAQVPLGQNGIHQHLGLDKGPASRLGVYEYRDLPRRPGGQGVRLPLGKAASHILHHSRALEDGRAKAYRPADGRGLCQIRHGHQVTRPVQPQGDPAGQIPRPLDQYAVRFHRSFRLSFPSRLSSPCCARGVPAL